MSFSSWFYVRNEKSRTMLSTSSNAKSQTWTVSARQPRWWQRPVVRPHEPNGPNPCRLPAHDTLRCSIRTQRRSGVLGTVIHHGHHDSGTKEYIIWATSYSSNRFKQRSIYSVYDMYLCVVSRSEQATLMQICIPFCNTMFWTILSSFDK